MIGPEMFYFRLSLKIGLRVHKTGGAVDSG